MAFARALEKDLAQMLSQKGWVPTFFLAIQKLIICLYVISLMFPDLKKIPSLFTTHFTAKCITCIFHTEHITGLVGIMKSISKRKPKSEIILKNILYPFWFLIVDFKCQNYIRKDKSKTNQRLFNNTRAAI